MERAMTESRHAIPRSSVVKVAFAGSFVLTAVLVLARMAGVLPMPQDMSPAGAIALCAGLTVLLAVTSVWYLARTDEHDLHANLWSMTWAWIAGALIAIDWAILHAARLAPTPDAMAILLVSAGVMVVVWLWLRFR